MRNDCIFIYLTHDLDFASSREKAKKVWIKSFSFSPKKWEIEDIPSNDIPEELLLKLLGSRRTIVFCEGKRNKNDELIYKTIFPNLNIVPVSTCKDVINYTKAFNRLANKYLNVLAIGIIDKDFREEKELTSLATNRIFTCPASEIENLLLIEEFLKIMAKNILKSDEDVEKIKNEIISVFEKEKELQSSNFVSSKINHIYSESHVKKGNTISDIKQNFNQFQSIIKIDDWYAERISTIQKIIETKNYKKTLTLFNNKGLSSIVQKHFKISDFKNRAMTLINTNEEARKSIENYFNEFLIEQNLKNK